jgi:Cdc6-like AAA superfamily ATPase
VNATIIKSSPQPSEMLFGEVAIGAGLNSCKNPTTLKQQLSRRPKKLVILILDEIDALLSDSKSGVRSKSEIALEEIVECAVDDNYPLALIGISNTIGSNKYERLQRIGKVSLQCDFSLQLKAHFD